MGFITGFVFLVFLYFFVKQILFVTPSLGIPITWGLLIIGVVGFVPVLIMYDRYKETFDYEPTTLFGRNTNGKAVRRFLNRMLIFFGWLIVTGLMSYLLTILMV